VSVVSGRLGKAEETETAPRDWRSSWGEALAGMVPFLIIGLAAMLIEWPRAVIPLPTCLNYLAGGLFLGGYLVLVVGLGIGWVKGFPRWSYSYVGYVLIFALYMMNVATPQLRIFNYTFQRNELWGWRSWIPFLVIAAIALVLTRSLRPLFRLVTNVCKDWTQLSFGLYGMMPLAVLLAFDEVDNSYQFPYMLLLTLILVEGALAYMRSARTWQRALALLVSTTLAVTVAAVGTVIYWKGPGNGWVNVGMTFIHGGYVVAAVFAPVLLGLLHRSIGSTRTA
jgi:hypothetical protein